MSADRVYVLEASSQGESDPGDHGDWVALASVSPARLAERAEAERQRMIDACAAICREEHPDLVYGDPHWDEHWQDSRYDITLTATVFENGEAVGRVSSQRLHFEDETGCPNVVWGPGRGELGASAEAGELLDILQG